MRRTTAEEPLVQSSWSRLDKRQVDTQFYVITVMESEIETESPVYIWTVYVI
jgi:hypothetical protein